MVDSNGYVIEQAPSRAQIEQYLALRDTENGPQLPDEEEAALLHAVFGEPSECGCYGRGD